MSLRRWTLIAVLGLGLGMASAPPAEAAQINSGIWTGDAYVDNNGRFRQCVITGDYPGEPDLGFGIDAAGVFEVFLRDPTWTLTPGGIEQITIQIDDGEAITGPFEALSRNVLGTRLVDRPQLVAGFKGGSVARMSGFFGSREFKLTGTAKAIGALEACVSGAMRGIQRQQQVAVNRNRLAGVVGDELFALGPRAFALRILMDLPQDQFVIPTDVEEASQRWRSALVWKIPVGLGRVTTVSGDPSEEELRSALVEMKAPTCRGELTSFADLRLLPGSDKVVKHVELQCWDTGNGTTAIEAMTFYPHNTGNLLMISHIAETEEAARTADLIFLQQIGRVSARQR